MSTAPSSLIDALSAADMLEIDDLHAGHFSLDNDLLAQVSAGTDGADSQQQPLLEIVCMDGRDRRQWQFSLAEVMAATYDAASDSWTLNDAGGPHRLRCFAAFRGDNEDEADDADER
ncbi:DUF5629 family protein [Pseudomonas zhanjiangensis]|uniref:DUF5629 family protein n=1 Tax=Pseudomonas zhanjiangensis TaxID=3239015 RepID=A0ABV3YVR2_9PSED